MPALRRNSEAVASFGLVCVGDTTLNDIEKENLSSSNAVYALRELHEGSEYQMSHNVYLHLLSGSCLQHGASTAVSF